MMKISWQIGLVHLLELKRINTHFDKKTNLLELKHINTHFDNKMCTFLKIDLPSAFVGIEIHQHLYFIFDK